MLNHAIMQHVKPLRGTSCQASKRPKSSPWQTSNSAETSSGQAAAKLSAAAKAAARRAAQFAKLRQQRAYQVAQEQYGHDNSITAHSNGKSNAGNGTLPTHDHPSSRKTAARPPPSTATNAPGQYDGLSPYVDVVTEHLKQQQGGNSGGGRGRGAKKAVARDLVDAHTVVFQAALDLELQQEWQEAEERLQSWPQSRLMSEGVALFGLAAAPEGAVARDVVMRFFVPEKPLPFHSFSQGDILLISQGDPLDDSQEAVVVDFSNRWIRLAMNPVAAGAVAAAAGGWPADNGSSKRQWRAMWRLDLFANTVSHERCSQALARFANAVVPQQGSAVVTPADLVATQLTQRQMQQQEHLCKVLAGMLPPGVSMEAAAAQDPPWLKSPQSRERLAAARTSIRAAQQAQQLNPSQASAVNAALCRTITLWQGPPGTGKTTTLLRFCEAALHVLPASGSRLLAVAASNVAVDQLVMGLLALGVKVVRLGQPAKITPALQSVTLEALSAATAAGQAALKIRQQLSEAAAANRTRNNSATHSSRGPQGRGARGGKNGGGRSSGRGSARSNGLWEQLLALEAAAAAEVFSQVQVVATTCVGAGDPVLQERFFDLCVLDEATQAPEPAALVAIAQKVQSLIMVGDPQQLPPTVRCQQAQKLGLGVSLFDRVHAMGLKPLLLDTQYRMHPKLAEFPSSKFYQGLLQSWPKPSDRPLPEGLPWPNPQVPVMFLQCKGRESRTAASIGVSRQRESLDSTDGDESSSSGGSGGYSYSNADEAALVFSCLKRLLVSGMLPQDVCVITPYSGQVRSIQALLTSDEAVGDQRVHSQSLEMSKDRAAGSGRRPRAVYPGSAGEEFLRPVEVKSVDGFQGREKEVVIFSAVRSNTQGRVGFLADARRLNVALTRAKRGLVVVGDASTLRCDRTWLAWLNWARKHGVIAEASALELKQKALL